MIKLFLEGQGYEVICAKNGEEAFMACEGLAERIDLIVTDIIMPGMTGSELADKVRIIHPETKILYMSGYVDQRVLNLIPMDGSYPFIQKPFSLDLLLRKIKELLEKKEES